MSNVQYPRRRDRRKRERGQALVEFGLVAIVFFAIVFGILDMASLFQSWNAVQHSSREGARYAITLQTSCVLDSQSFGTRAACIEATGKRATSGLSGGGLDASPSRVQVTTKAWGYPNYPDPGTDGARGYICDIIEVTVKYQYKFMTPILQGIIPGGVPLTGRQRMTNEPSGDCGATDADDPTGP